MTSSEKSARAASGWGGPLARLDEVWSRLEERLAVGVLLTEVFTLVVWVALKALADSHAVSGSAVGVLFRGVVGAFVLGTIAQRALRPKPGAVATRAHSTMVTAAVILGLASGQVWSELGVGWSSNAAGWLQNASALALIGGPRGLVTRLTLWLALLGASLAASRGKHISVDLAIRHLPTKIGAPVTMLGWIAAALVCFAASWGFVDSIAVTKFRAEAFRPCEGVQAEAGGLCETRAGERLGRAVEGVGRDLFLLGRQLSLDLMTFPHILKGDAYEKYLTAPVWNAWVEEGNWTSRYAPDEVSALLLPTSDPTLTKMPLISEPGTGEGRDLLIRDLNFILPFGLFMIGLKFLLRTLRMLSGELEFDPGAQHDHDGLAHAREQSGELDLEGSAP